MDNRHVRAQSIGLFERLNALSNPYIARVKYPSESLREEESEEKEEERGDGSILD